MTEQGARTAARRGARRVVVGVLLEAGVAGAQALAGARAARVRSSGAEGERRRARRGSSSCCGSRRSATVADCKKKKKKEE